MKNKKRIYFIVIVLIAFGVALNNFYERNSIKFFVIESSSENTKAFKVSLFFDHAQNSIEAISLNGAQLQDAQKIMAAQNVTALKNFAQGFDQYDFVIAFSGLADNWIDHWNGFWPLDSTETALSDLTWADKLYLNTEFNFKLTDQNIDKAVKDKAALATPVVKTQSVTVFTPVPELNVRVEILNGCGIKGAVDRVVKQIKTPSLQVVNGGNAESFSYKKSVVISKLPLPNNLKEALVQMGLTHIKVESTKPIPSGYDAVLILGKDMRKLKGN